MTLTRQFWPALAFALVVSSWLAFIIAFVTRKKPASPPDTRRARGSIIGVVLQGVSYLIAWSFYRRPFSSIIPMRRAAEILVTLLTIALAVASSWFVYAAIRTLGKEWSLTARLVEGHKLVTRGPYSIVRNPIYTGMFGMLLATGLAVSHWSGLLLAITVFAAGTTIRIHTEEKLLRDAFGAEFEAYAGRVPAIIPFIY